MNRFANGEPGTADPESGPKSVSRSAFRPDGSGLRRLRAVRQMTLDSVAVYLHLPQSPHAVALYSSEWITPDQASRFGYAV